MFVFPSYSKQIIDSIRATVGRLVTIYVKEGQIACSACSLDPITNLSQDSFCPVCHGDYWLPTISGYPVTGHVRWQSADLDMYTRAGIIPVGDCKVTIANTEKNLDRVRRSTNWDVDGKSLYVEKFQLKGIRGVNEKHVPNRIVIYLKEEEEDAT